MLKQNPRYFVALDRDGTINVELYRPITDPVDIKLLPGAIDGLKHMSEMGLGLFIITNQSGVAKGYLNQSNMDSIHNRLEEILTGNSIYMGGIYVCPHSFEAGCSCRKPESGLLEIAANELHFDPDNCFLVGDKISDLECGRNFGATTILVRTGYGADVESQAIDVADYVEDDLCGAANTIEKIIFYRQRGII